MKESVLREKLEQCVIGSDPAHSGGIFMGGEIIKTASDGAAKTLQKSKEYQNAAKIPLLIPADIESGCGCAVSGLTALPLCMGMGAANSTELAYNYGLVTAKEARSVGINWAFAPVCDLNVNSRNPLVNVRSVSDRPEVALPILKAIVKGMQDGGIAACIKHFPGDGVDWRDQHHVTTCNALSREEYMQMHGKVFAELIQAGVYSVMIGHITLPSYQTEKVDGLYPPATLSRELMVDLLRGEMGFKGLIVSDALMMGGYLGWNRSNEESELITFKNGCDMMLWPRAGFVDRAMDAVQNGFIPESRVNEAYTHIMELKEKLGLFNGDPVIPLSNTDKALANETQQACYDRSITVVCDKNHQLPFQNVQKIALVPVGGVPNREDIVHTLTAAFAERGAQVTVYNHVANEHMPAMAQENDKILFVMMTRPHLPAGPLDFFEWDASAMWSSLCEGKEKTVAVGMGSPYFKNQYFERGYTFLNTYTPDIHSANSLVKALYGEIEITDFSPVTL